MGCEGDHQGLDSCWKAGCRRGGEESERVGIKQRPRSKGCARLVTVWHTPRGMKEQRNMLKNKTKRTSSRSYFPWETMCISAWISPIDIKAQILLQPGPVFPSALASNSLGSNLAFCTYQLCRWLIRSSACCAVIGHEFRPPAPVRKPGRTVPV